MDEESWAGRESGEEKNYIVLAQSEKFTWSKVGAQDGGPEEQPTQLQATWIERLG